MFYIAANTCSVSPLKGYEFSPFVTILQGVKYLLVLVIAVFLASCAPREETSLLVPSSQVLEPQAAAGITLARSETAGVAIQTEGEDGTPVLPVPEGLNLIATVNTNLDTDNSEEQIIAVRRRGDPSAPIELLVADFDEIRGQYMLAWQGTTAATVPRSFSIITTDVTGDHRPEIIAIGIDNEGNQTMNMFHRPSSRDLRYTEIFSSVTAGSLEIEERRRSDSYRTLLAPGESYRIVENRRRERSDNPLDLVRRFYRWDPAQVQYVISEVEEISGERVAQTQLQELYNASSQELESFLSGPWFKASGDNIGPSLEIVVFDAATQEISMFRQDAQERYQWLNSYKTLYERGPGLWINARNSVLRTIRRQVSITLLGVDTIRLSVEDAEYWNGTYQRMSPAIQDSVVRRHAVARPDFNLRGVFRNDNNQEILFEEPRFRFRAGGIDWSGGFNLVMLDQPVLELNVVSTNAPNDAVATIGSNGRNTFSTRFAVSYQEQSSEDRMIRRITLRPVRLTVDGIRETGGEVYVLEQVEEYQLEG